MQVIVFIDRLRKALSLVSRIVSSKSQLPILGNVLLSAEKGNLFLTTTNLEAAITTKITAAVEKEGKITIPVKQLNELASLIKEEKIKLFIDNNNLVLESKKTKNSLNTAPASEFPSIITKQEEANIIIAESEFKKAIEQIAIATSPDESRPVLGGALFAKKEKTLEVAATDGYRLSVKEMKTTKNQIEKTHIFPIKTLLEVTRIASEQEEKEIKISLLDEKNQAIFLFENTEVITRLIGGEFPNFQKIIPASHTTKTVIDKEDFLNAVKMAAVFARESANIVKIKISNRNLVLSANAPQVGENKASLDIEQEGDDLEIAFNYRFLLDFLLTIEEERIVLETTGSLNPGVFKPEKDTSLLHIIMPVRVQT